MHNLNWQRVRNHLPRNAKPCTEILSRDSAGRALTARGYVRAGSKRLIQGVVRAGDNCSELALEDACLLVQEGGR